MHYARKGIITPEMEFIAIRENLGRSAGVSPVLAENRLALRLRPAEISSARRDGRGLARGLEERKAELQSERDHVAEVLIAPAIHERP